MTDSSTRQNHHGQARPRAQQHQHTHSRTQELALWYLHHPVGRGQHPQNTRADFGQEAVGLLVTPRPQSTTSVTGSQPNTLHKSYESRMVAEPRLRSHDEGCSGVLRTSKNNLSSSLPLLPGNCAVVSAFKNPDSWLKSLCQQKEAGGARRRE